MSKSNNSGAFALLSDAQRTGLSRESITAAEQVLADAGVKIGDRESINTAMAAIAKADTLADALKAVAAAGALVAGDVDALSTSTETARVMAMVGKAAADFHAEKAQAAALRITGKFPNVSPADVGRAFENIADDVKLSASFRVRWSRYVAVANATHAQAAALKAGKSKSGTEVSPKAMMSLLTSGKVNQTDLVRMARQGVELPTASIDKASGKGTPKRKRTDAPEITWETVIASIITLSEQLKSVKGEPTDLQRGEVQRVFDNVRDNVNKHGVK